MIYNEIGFWIGFGTAFLICIFSILIVLMILYILQSQKRQSK